MFKLDRAGKVNLRLTGSTLTEQEALASSVSDDGDGRCSDENTQRLQHLVGWHGPCCQVSRKGTTEEGFKKVPLLRDSIRLVICAQDLLINSR